MDQDIYHSRIRLAMRHPEMRCVAISQMNDYSFMRKSDRLQREEWPTFIVNRFAGEMRIEYEHSQNPYVNFQSVDCTPHMIERQVKNIEDLILFTPARVQTKEIIVDEREVKDLLDEIMQRQQPKQAEIRERIRREEARAKAHGEIPELQTQLIHHANILTFPRKVA